MNMEVKIKEFLPNNSGDLPTVQLDKAHSPSKALYHQELIDKFVSGEEFNPIHLRIGITGRCNMRCTFCNFHSGNEVQFYDRFSFKDEMTTEQVKTLLKSFYETGGTAVTFCGSGESTIHSGYIEICNFAHDLGLEIGLITNGARMDKPAIFDVVARTHKWVRVGLNSGTPEVFETVTKLPARTFDHVVRVAGKLKAAAVDPEFVCGYNYVITLENYMDILTAAQLTSRYGADYLRYEPEFYSALGHETIADKMDEIVDLLEQARPYARDDFEISIPKLDRGPMDQTDEIEGAFDKCHYSRFVTAVGADGELYPCPQVHLNSRYRIGNVTEGSYAEVLHEGPRQEWEASNPLRTDLCKTCFYRPQNELLQALLDRKVDPVAAVQTALSDPDLAPVHRNFV
jgi:radical SAM protein with 4Fe4S-binding SPASM domain